MTQKTQVINKNVFFHILKRIVFQILNKRNWLFTQKFKTLFVFVSQSVFRFIGLARQRRSDHLRFFYHFIGSEIDLSMQYLTSMDFQLFA